MKWDVYIWPVNAAGFVRIAAKNVKHSEAQEICKYYMDAIGMIVWDAYMVPTGTKISM